VQRHPSDWQAEYIESLASFWGTGRLKTFCFRCWIRCRLFCRDPSAGPLAPPTAPPFPGFWAAPGAPDAAADAAPFAFAAAAAAPQRSQCCYHRLVGFLALWMDHQTFQDHQIMRFSRLVLHKVYFFFNFTSATTSLPTCCARKGAANLGFYSAAFLFMVK